MITLLGAIFVASLVGSLHCIGMCGGVVAISVAGRPVERGRLWMAPLLYNSGRLVTYAGLGAVSGAIGAAIDFGGNAAGMTRTAAILAGVAMIVFGLLSLLDLRTRLTRIELPRGLQSLVQRGFRTAHATPHGIRPLLIGLLTGFLPCGWLYAFVISAAGTGHPALGALVMTSFWAGTLPALVALGFGLGKLSIATRNLAPRLTAAALVAVGLVTVIGRFDVPAYADHAIATPTRNHAIEAAEAGPPACCDDDT